ncbi:MAG: DMT family transporter [Erysipelotrichaceae bacterium]|nr:DMT family transporter [Erysipelotrichaceae bacterium]
MYAGIIAGITWAIDTIILGIVLGSMQFISDAEAILLAPFVLTFLHDLFSAVYCAIFNLLKGNRNKFIEALRSKNGRFIALASLIGGPVGMSGYVMAVANLGSSLAAVGSAIYPAVGSILAHFFLKEKLPLYRFVFLLIALCGIYGLSYSPQQQIVNLGLGVLGIMMCGFGWGIEAVIIAKCVKDDSVTNETALQIRQSTSALIYGLVILPIVKGYDLVLSLFEHNLNNVVAISTAALFGTVSYLFYYEAITKIGASKAMALNSTYAAWAVIISAVILKDYSLLNPVTIICTLVVIVFGVLAGTDLKEL